MTTSYLPDLPGPRLLLPPALQDWLPQGHLADIISDTIDALDLSGFYKRSEGGGSRNQPSLAVPPRDELPCSPFRRS